MTEKKWATDTLPIEASMHVDPAYEKAITSHQAELNQQGWYVDEDERIAYPNHIKLIYKSDQRFEKKAFLESLDELSNYVPSIAIKNLVMLFNTDAQLTDQLNASFETMRKRLGQDGKYLLNAGSLFKDVLDLEANDSPPPAYIGTLGERHLSYQPSKSITMYYTMTPYFGESDMCEITGECGWKKGEEAFSHQAATQMARLICQLRDNVLKQIEQPSQAHRR